MADECTYFKVRKRFYILHICWLVFFTELAHTIAAQEKNTGNLLVISRAKEFNKQCKADSLRKMVSLEKSVPGILLDLRYGTTGNFTGKKLYSQTSFTCLRQPVATALNKVQEDLNAKGMGLKIFDAYRPYAATVKMWDLIRDERYVADPKKGSGHNRGIAVDLTIINLQTGKELDMGTGFDNFTDTAHHAFTALPEEVLQNRIFLKTLMEKYGFRAFDTEWWHYSWPNDGRYDVLNISFRKMKKLSR